MFTVRGGVLATLMDTATGSAVFTNRGDIVAYAAPKLNSRLAVAQLTGAANAVHARRMAYATAEGRITGAGGKLIVHGLDHDPGAAAEAVTRIG
ncbi:hypothetical protein ACWEKR_34685 [Nocardia sp. NPDC004573]